MIFVDDPYDVTDSIKGEEHLRRNCVNWSKNVYIKSNDKLPNRTNLLIFFTNKSNKIRLQNFLNTEFQKLSQSYPRKSLFVQCKATVKTLKQA